MSELSHLDQLEAEAIYIIREVAASCEKPVSDFDLIIKSGTFVFLKFSLKEFVTFGEIPPTPVTKAIPTKVIKVIKIKRDIFLIIVLKTFLL